MVKELTAPVLVLACPLCEEDEDGDQYPPGEFSCFSELVAHLVAEHDLLMAEKASRGRTRVCRVCRSRTANPLMLTIHLRVGHARQLARRWAARAERRASVPDDDDAVRAAP